MLINFLVLVWCLGNSAIAGKTEATFDVIDSEGTIASSATAGIVKEIARDLKKNGKVREYK